MAQPGLNNSMPPSLMKNELATSRFYQSYNQHRARSTQSADLQDHVQSWRANAARARSPGEYPRRDGSPTPFPIAPHACGPGLAYEPSPPAGQIPAGSKKALLLAHPAGSGDRKSTRLNYS